MVSCDAEAVYEVHYAPCGICGDASPMRFCVEHTALIRRLEVAMGALYCLEDHQDVVPEEADATPIVLVKRLEPSQEPS